MSKKIGNILIMAGILLLCMPVMLHIFSEYKNKSAVSSIKAEIAEIKINTDDPDVQKNSKKTKTKSNKSYIGLISIPKLNEEFPIEEGTEAANLRYTIGHYKNTAALGDIGNCVLAGHRGSRFGTFFKNLDKLKSGDEIILTSMTGSEFTYTVDSSKVVEPDDMSVIDSYTDGEANLTLITCCYTSHGKKRLIYRCTLKTTE